MNVQTARPADKILATLLIRWFVYTLSKRHLVALEALDTTRGTKVVPAVLLPIVDEPGVAHDHLELVGSARLRGQWSPERPQIK